MNHRGRESGSARSGAFFGVVLVVVGTALLLERLDLMPTNLMRHFWPVAWMLLGGLLLIGNRSPVAQGWGVVLLVLGIGLELEKFGLIRFRMRDLWPVQLIALGIFLLWRALRPPGRNAAERVDTARISEYSMFGGAELKVVSPAFEGGNLTAIFGGQQVDFHGTQMAHGEAVLYADAIFGGVSLRVPPSWRVTVSGPAIFGGIDSSKALPPVAGDGPHLFVKGLAIFGGVEVKN